MSDKSQREYTVKTSFDQATGAITHVVWSNELGLTEAPADLPSEVRLSTQGLPVMAFWFRANLLHRDGDLPAAIYFDEFGRPTSWHWYQNDRHHRDGDKPAEITFADGTLSKLRFVGFYRHGEPFRSGGRAPIIEICANGKAIDDVGKRVQFEGFNKLWLPSPVPTLLVPQPLLLKPSLD